MVWRNYQLHQNSEVEACGDAQIHWLCAHAPSCIIYTTNAAAGAAFIIGGGRGSMAAKVVTSGNARIIDRHMYCRCVLCRMQRLCGVCSWNYLTSTSTHVTQLTMAVTAAHVVLPPLRSYQILKRLL
jgi:hypothetical protein